jgi:hypothetical protein
MALQMQLRSQNAQLQDDPKRPLTTIEEEALG